MTAIITGASGGVGRAAALALAREGYDAALHYHQNREPAVECAAEIEKIGGRAAVLNADLSSEGDALRMAEEAVILLGGIDVLVCAAGRSLQKTFIQTTPEDWEGVISSNLTSVYNSCRAVMPYMLRQGKGSIVTVSSVWGQAGASCEVTYSAAKAGIIGLTRALAKEMAPSGIRVNCVAPGAIDTKMLSGLDGGAISDIIARTPLGRLGRPDDVAEAIAFLASDRASFITGEVLTVSGLFNA